ncbi:hypothetical protein KEM48_000953 [Puccinia striiformis f. sp. tritici PST-130]|nr:hypothetical protein KEM48_000953 [Puccinia striiformis f. sp. tritici PST-130]
MTGSGVVIGVISYPTKASIVDTNSIWPAFDVKRLCDVWVAFAADRTNVNQNGGVWLTFGAKHHPTSLDVTQTFAGERWPFAGSAIWEAKRWHSRPPVPVRVQYLLMSLPLSIVLPLPCLFLTSRAVK